MHKRALKHRTRVRKLAMAHVDSHHPGEFEVQVVPNDLRSIIAPKEAILSALERNGFPESDIFAIKLALEEALTNAVKHGNANDPGKRVTVRYSITPARAVVIVRDEGPGFMPENVPDCTCAERLPVPSGRGIMLMKAYMDMICYRDKGREVYFVKERSNGNQAVSDTEKPPSGIRRVIRFSGKVQGVGFRFNSESIASGFGITGYVRNLSNGQVEMVVEGPKSEIDRFQSAVEQAMKDHIERTEAEERAATGEFLSFRITL